MRRLLIVDDHDGFRSWAREVLEQEGFDVVGEAADGRSAIRLTRALRPEVVLIDVQLPDLDGFTVAATVAGSAAVVLTSARPAEEFGRQLSASVHAFLPKEALSGGALEAKLVERR
jgi:DNA-binding NarL/FixJ family response regulator